MKKSVFLSVLYSVLFVLLGVILFLSISTTGLAKVDIAGELDLSLLGSFFSQSEFLFYPQANLDLELFLPSFNDNQIKAQAYLFTNPATRQLNFFIKKLYLKHDFNQLQLTVGRQPVSWSFGSLLNPVDFTLGSVVADEEGNSKFKNAVEAYYPINWNSSIVAVAAFPKDLKNPKWGFRGRTTWEGYDLTLNYVREARDDGNEVGSPRQRIGFSAKGDLGPFGVYGAIAYNYQDIESGGDFALLLGGDYSYYFEAGNQISFQLEYLLVKEERLSDLLGSLGFGGGIVSSQKNIHLASTSTTYAIDEFSSISLLTMTSLGDLSTVLMPSYTNQIKNNLTFNGRLSLFLGGQDSLFGPGPAGSAQAKPKLTVQAGLTHYF